MLAVTGSAGERKSEERMGRTFLPEAVLGRRELRGIEEDVVERRSSKELLDRDRSVSWSSDQFGVYCRMDREKGY